MSGRCDRRLTPEQIATVKDESYVRHRTGKP